MEYRGLPQCSAFTWLVCRSEKRGTSVSKFENLVRLFAFIVRFQSATMVSTSEGIIKLINLIRENPILYDANHKHFKNIMKKTEAWDEVANKMNESTKLVKNKWKHLRDSCLRFQRNMETDPDAAKKFENWAWSEHLAFLNDISHPTRKTRLSSKLSPVELIEVELPSSAGEEQDDEDVESLRRLSKAFKKRKLNCGDASSSGVEELYDAAVLLNKPQPLDRIDNLFLSYAETFKTFQPATQAMVKLKLATLFSETEIKELEEARQTVAVECEQFLYHN